jgi:hypothetical protein
MERTLVRKKMAKFVDLELLFHSDDDQTSAAECDRTERDDSKPEEDEEIGKAEVKEPAVVDSVTLGIKEMQKVEDQKKAVIQGTERLHFTSIIVGTS